MSAKPRSKQVRVGHEDLDVLDTKPAGGRIVMGHGDGTRPETTDNGKVRRRRNPAKKTKKTTKTANDLMLEAWKYTYEHRHRRLTKP